MMEEAGQQFFDVRKKRPIAKIMNTAKKIIRDCMPIRCVEAVFLALYVTAGIKKLNRFPLSFKTEVTHKGMKM